VALILHIDTDAYSAYMRGQDDAVSVIDRSPAIALSPVVIGELKAGFALGSRRERNLLQLRRVLESPRLLVPPIEEGVTDNYARIYKQLREDGKPIPTNDMWIAACALGEEEALFTLDGHFDSIKGLRVIHGKGDFESLLK